MRLFILLSLFLIYSCERTVSFEIALSDYIKKNPIKIKDYNYIVRFYKKNSDTLVEFSQDKNYKIYPIDFGLYTIENKQLSPYKMNTVIYLGVLSKQSSIIYFYDTEEHLSKKILAKESFNLLDNNFKEGIYPFLPKRYIYLLKKDKLLFLEEKDTIWAE